ncbi:MAG: hypothetical protein IT467_04770 [Dokdonella sp.]|uniref:hypothetical protein n=1 Tax=Dokdonella sp. TaxID=2291710 RepID=UPI0025BD1C20|nr:hypothetical protein [Dokdonella sp.]MBZ0221781.1 Dol-P-Glc:Glc(2)Man(9)GlcNAc(2)-PP-Dol alpha-1,2-glucosyltransferase [Dokdonella sp.]MCC7255231.1 hypothetical protein [Dokdonella sp.]
MPEKPRPVRGFSFLERARATTTETWLLALLCGMFYAGWIIGLRWQAAYTDEIIHYAQIWLFAQGQWRVLSDLTTIPGYHLLVAGLLDASGAVSLQGARLVNALFGLSAVAALHALRMRLWPGTQTLASAQLLLLPILAPLFFLVYTDVLALALLLWAIWAAVVGRHWLAAMFLTALVCVRQHEIVWGGLLVALALRDADMRSLLRQWRSSVLDLLPYGLPLAAFLAFWAGNGSISLSRSQSALHPDFSLHAGNLLFALLVFGLLLPLQTVLGFVTACRSYWRRPWFVPSLILIAACFWFWFRADNPYNGAFPQLYLHNRIPLLIEQNAWLRAAASVLAAAVACSLAVTRLRPARAAWLFGFSALFLAASWLVELRYVMVPIVVWLALREQRGRLVEWLTFGYWALLSCWLLQAILAHSLFL